MVKQLLITLTRIPVQLDAKAFLVESLHSPEWIGVIDNWSISSFQVDNGKITALLENRLWQAPEVKSLTVGEFCEIAREHSPAQFSLAKREGYNLKTTTFRSELKTYTQVIDGIRYMIINSEGTEVYSKKMSVLYDALAGEGAWRDEKEPAHEDMSLSLAVRLSKYQLFPITRYKIENDKLLLIFNQDINLLRK